MTTLVFVRHGETDWNRGGRIQGTTDIPLNGTGRMQAADAADALRAQLDGPVAIVSSDLSRARETADIIAARLGLPSPTAYPHLRERAYGEAEGLTADEITERWGRAHAADIPGAESAPALRRRALHAVRRVVRDVRRASAPGSATVIVVSHGAVIRELARHATRGELPEPGTRLPNGGGYTMLWERDRVRIVDDARSVDVALID